MANNSSLSKRAALRQQQELEERNKRNKRILGAGAAIVAVVAVVVIAIVVVQVLGGAGGRASKQFNPAGATAKYGIVVGDKPKAEVPHLVIWEDFQCPACKNYEDQFGAAVEELRAEGSITLEYRTAHFLDEQIRNTSSKRAALAAAAAAEVGHFAEYHKVVFQNQPQEGVGYTDKQLREEFPAQAGIQGDNLTRFQELYDSSPFHDFINGAEELFKTQAGSTPTYLVAGQKLEFATEKQQLIQPDKTSLKSAITKAWDKGSKNNDF